MGERDEDLERVREALEHISESIDEVALTQAQQGTRLDAVERNVQALATAINGSDTGKAAGLKTRIAVLEDREKTRREESKPAPIPVPALPAPVPSEIAQVEMAREAAASKRWEAVKSWAPLAAVGGAAVAKIVEWALGALGGK